VVAAALNGLLSVLGKTLLTTPTPDQLPRLGELWHNSWEIVVASYAVLVTIAGVIVMAHETAQTRYSIKDLAARIPLGFIAAAMSLFLSGQAIVIANALSHAVMTPGIDENSAADTLRNIVLSPLNATNSGFYIVLLGGVMAGMLVALLITYAVRVALTVLLIAGCASSSPPAASPSSAPPPTAWST
jgi:Mn2+/Fe2+ NRAMP family transporter